MRARVKGELTLSLTWEGEGQRHLFPSRASAISISDAELIIRLWL